MRWVETAKANATEIVLQHLDATEPLLYDLDHSFQRLVWDTRCFSHVPLERQNLKHRLQCEYFIGGMQ